MPFSDADQLLKEDEQGSVTSTQPIVGGSGVQSLQPSGNSLSQASPNRPSPGSGRFSNLDEYLRVNQGQNFGEQLAGKVGEDIGKAGQTLTDATGQFRSRADASTVRDDQGLIDQLSSSPEDINVDDFSRLRDAEYKGPSNLTDTPDLYNQVQGASGTAAGKAGASKTEGGRFALLDNYFGRPSYNQGQKSLDNLLVQNDPNSQQAFKQMQENAKQLEGRTRQAGVDLGNYGSQAKAQTEATRSSARSGLGIDDAGNYSGGGAIGGVVNTVNDAYQSGLEQKQKAEDTFGAIGNAPNLSSLTPEQRAAMGDPTATAAMNPWLSWFAPNYAPTNPDAYTPDNWSSGVQLPNSSTWNPTFIPAQFNNDPNAYLEWMIQNGQMGSNNVMAPLRTPEGFTFGVNPQSYKNIPGTLNAGEFATPEQIARLNALTKLADMGDEQTFIPTGDDVGKYASSPISTFDTQGFNSSVSQARQNYLNDVGTLLQQNAGQGTPPGFNLQQAMASIRAKYGLT